MSLASPQTESVLSAAGAELPEAPTLSGTMPGDFRQDALSEASPCNGTTTGQSEVAPHFDAQSSQVSEDKPMESSGWFSNIWSGVVGTVKLVRDVAVGCAREGGKLIREIASAVHGLATSPAKRTALWSSIKSAGRITLSFGKAALGLGKALCTFAVGLARDPQLRGQFFAGVKASLSSAYQFLKNPTNWKAAGRFLKELSDSMGFTDVASGVLKLLTNPLEGLAQIGKGLFKLSCEFTGLADLGRALVCFAKGDRAGAAFYLGMAAGDLIKTAMIVSAVFTGGATLAAVPGLILGVTGLKKSAQKGAIKGLAIIGRHIGEEFAEKIECKAVTQASEKALTELTGQVLKGQGARHIVSQFEGQLSEESLKALGAALRQAGVQLTKNSTVGVSVESLLETVMKNSRSSTAGIRLISELAEIGEERSAALFQKGFAKAAGEVSRRRVRGVAFKSLEDLRNSIGFDDEFVRKELLRKLESYGKLSKDQIVAQLRELAPNASDRELKKMARSLRHFAKNRLGKKFDQKAGRQLSEAVFAGMEESFERRGIRDAFLAPVDAYGKRFGLSDELSAAWKEEFDKSLKKWKGVLKDVVEAGARRAMHDLREKKWKRKFGLPTAKEAVRRTKRALTPRPQSHTHLDDVATPSAEAAHGQPSFYKKVRSTNETTNAPTGRIMSTHSNYDPNIYVQVDSTLMKSSNDYRGLFHTEAHPTRIENSVEAPLPTNATSASKSGTTAAGTDGVDQSQGFDFHGYRQNGPRRSTSTATASKNMSPTELIRASTPASDTDTVKLSAASFPETGRRRV